MFFHVRLNAKIELNNMIYLTLTNLEYIILCPQTYFSGPPVASVVCLEASYHCILKERKLLEKWTTPILEILFYIAHGLTSVCSYIYCRSLALDSTIRWFSRKLLLRMGLLHLMGVVVLTYVFAFSSKFHTWDVYISSLLVILLDHISQDLK